MAKIISEFKKQIAALIASAFGFVAALQWNEAIKEWLKPIIANGGGALALTESAIIITIITVIAIYTIGKLSK